MAASSPALAEIISKINDFERRLDRMAAARILSAPIGTADIATGSIINNNHVGVGQLHPNRLSSWSGATYTNYVLYDTGAGISVTLVNNAHIAANTIHGNRIQTATLTGTQVADASLTGADIAVNTVHGNRIQTGTLTKTQVASREMMSFSFQNWSNGTNWGAGAWVYPGGVAAITGEPGNTIVVGVLDITVYSNTPAAILYAGVGVDSLSPGWYTQTNQMAGSASYINNVCLTFMHTLDVTTRNYYPVIMSNAGSLNQYSNAHFSLMGFHR